MKTLQFTYLSTFGWSGYVCDTTGDQSGHYVRAEDVRELVIEHRLWADLLGRAIIAALQGNDEGFVAIKNYFSIDFPDGEPSARSAALKKLEATK